MTFDAELLKAQEHHVGVQTTRVERARKYRKKPVVIEALRYDGTNWAAICTWMGNEHVSAVYGDVGIVIKTLEGAMVAGVGDWVLRGVAGEFYPCKDTIFRAIYEPVDE